MDYEENKQKAFKKWWGTYGLLVLMVSILLLVIIGGAVLLRDTYRMDDPVEVTVTVTSVERKVAGDIFGGDLFDRRQVSGFVFNTEESFLMPDGKSYSHFIFADDRFSFVPMSFAFRRLYDFPKYWGNFKVKIKLSLNSSIGTQPELVKVLEYIHPVPPE